jgi:hypothetical protein
VANYLATHAERIGRVRDLQQACVSSANPAPLSVIAAELRALAARPERGRID